MSKKISQATARRYKRQLEELQQKTRDDRNTWRGACIRCVQLNETSVAVLQAVKDVDCVLAVRLNGSNLEVYGVQ